MKILTKKSDYAIRALLMLAAKQGSYLSAKAIATEQDIPYQFLRGVLQEMIRANMIVAKEGAQGGVKLVKDPADIRVSDIIELFQGAVQVSECMFRKQICANRSRCVLRHEILRIEQVVSDEFSKITIGSLRDKLAAMNTVVPLQNSDESVQESEFLKSGSE